MKKKYKLTNITMEYKGRTLYRIKALKNFNDVKKGDLGGWVEDETNLNQFDNSWVYDEGKVYDNGIVYDHGRVFGHGEVFEYGEVFGYGRVYEYGKVHENGQVGDYGVVFRHGEVYGFGKVYEFGKVDGNGKVYEYGKVYGNGEVFGYGEVRGNGELYGDGTVFGNGTVIDETINTKISIPYKAIIQMQCKKRAINALLTEDNKVVFNIGCKNNITKETFIDRIYNEDGGLENNPHRQEYLDYIDFMESYLLSKKGDVK